MESDEIPSDCNQICSTLKIGTISRHFEGTAQFLKKANDYYGS